jgi:hypothetical protein
MKLQTLLKVTFWLANTFMNILYSNFVIGSFGYINDMSMVGTVFINTLANILVQLPYSMVNQQEQLSFGYNAAQTLQYKKFTPLVIEAAEKAQSGKKIHDPIRYSSYSSFEKSSTICRTCYEAHLGHGNARR